MSFQQKSVERPKEAVGPAVKTKHQLIPPCRNTCTGNLSGAEAFHETPSWVEDIPPSFL